MTWCVSLLLSDDSKQDSATTTANRKHIIEFWKQHNIMSDKLSKPWENTDGCDEN